LRSDVPTQQNTLSTDVLPEGLDVSLFKLALFKVSDPLSGGGKQSLLLKANVVLEFVVLGELQYGVQRDGHGDVSIRDAWVLNESALLFLLFLAQEEEGVRLDLIVEERHRAFHLEDGIDLWRVVQE